MTQGHLCDTQRQEKEKGPAKLLYSILKFPEASPVPTHRTLKGHSTGLLSGRGWWWKTNVFHLLFFFFFVFCNKYLLGKESIQRPKRKMVNVGILEVLTASRRY